MGPDVVAAALPTGLALLASVRVGRDFGGGGGLDGGQPDVGRRRGRLGAAQQGREHHDRGERGQGAGSELGHVRPPDPLSTHASPNPAGSGFAPRRAPLAKVVRRLARDYELVLMLDPAAPDGRRDEVAGETQKRIESGGELKQADTWGMRKLAFEIRQRTEADYRFYRFEADNDLLEQLDHTLKITDGVLRFRIFKVDVRTPTMAPPPTAQPAGVSARAAKAEARRASRPTETAVQERSAEAPAAPAKPAEAGQPAEADSAEQQPAAEDEQRSEEGAGDEAPGDEGAGEETAGASDEQA